jgi:hypothetical protein
MSRPACLAGELLCQEAAAAAHVQHVQCGRVQLQLVYQDVPHVAEAHRVRSGLEEVEERSFLPPRVRQAVVKVVVRH